MLEEDGNNEEDAGDDNETELFFQTMFVMMLVRTSVAVMVFVMMCHSFIYNVTIYNLRFRLQR